MSDAIPLTYRELGERLGLSPDSARIKAKRRKWQTIPGNHPSDPVRVLVPVEFLSGERTPERTAGERTPSAPPDKGNKVNAIRDALEQQREDATRERTEHAAERERLRQEISDMKAEMAAERQYSRELSGKLIDAHREHSA